MDREAAQAYARRDWGAVERLRLRERQAAFRKGGSAATIGVSRRLWEFVRSLNPGWPPKRAREEDLAHHVELKRRLDRAGRALTLR